MKVHVAHILVEHAYEAEDLVKMMEQGKSFEALAQKYSKCPSGARGGDLGLVELSRFDEVFAEAVRPLQPGAMSSIVRTRFGHHLIYRKA